MHFAVTLVQIWLCSETCLGVEAVVDHTALPHVSYAFETVVKKRRVKASERVCESLVNGYDMGLLVLG